MVFTSTGTAVNLGKVFLSSLSLLLFFLFLFFPIQLKTSNFIDKQTKKVLSVEANKKSVQIAKAGDEVAVKIHGNGNMVGRQFTEKDELFSLVCVFFLISFFCFFSSLPFYFFKNDSLFSCFKISFQISRESINAIKENFADEITKADLKLFVELKKKFGIV